MNLKLIPLGLVTISGLLLGGCAVDASDISNNTDDLLREKLAENNIQQLTFKNHNPDQVELGKALFFDPILSGNDEVSCATCHHTKLGSDDNLPLPIGVGGEGMGADRTQVDGHDFIPRNAPEVFNRGHRDFTNIFWDSRLKGNSLFGFTSPAGGDLPNGLNSALAAQSLFPITSRHEMRGFIGDSDVSDISDGDFIAIWDQTMTDILSIPEYVTLFNKAYPNAGGVFTISHYANAMAAFEDTAFRADNSPFDDYANGDNTALTEHEKLGALLFYGKAKCSQCHSGSLFTDQKEHAVGVPQLGPGKQASGSDPGLALETNNPADNFKFRTPQLRNVELTAPYFHAGSHSSLKKALRYHLDPILGSYTYNPSEELPASYQSEVYEGDNAAIRQAVSPLLKDGIELTNDEFHQLLSFLLTLTDPDSRDMDSFEPESVPSGLPVGGI